MSKRSETRSRRATKARARTDRIFREIRHGICLLDYPPGHVLREEDLARRFRVSRSPIRRVLHWLERDGLVEGRQGVGTTVTTFNLQDLLDTYALRAKLAEAIDDTRVVPPRPAVVARLERLSEECGRLSQRFDPRRFGEINIDLHTQILSIVGSTALRETSEYLFYQTTRLWFGLLDESNWQREVEDMRQESADIAEAMRHADYKAVGIIRRNRLSGVMVRLRCRFANMPGGAVKFVPKGLGRVQPVVDSCV